MSQAPDAQAAVVALLADPATHGGERPERIDTHISTVFLAGDRALKLKKAVTLPFLDFAPLAARKTACEAEARVNARGAPGVYQGVLAVTRGSDGQLSLGGEGEAVDYVVVMRRFGQETLFDRLAGAGKLDRRVMMDLAEAVAAYHDGGEPDDRLGGSAAILATIRGNRLSFLANAPAVFDPAAVEALTDRSLALGESLAALMDARRAAGCVRRCHGDLHLRNIALYDGHPILFDAIEFNDDFAVIDTLYDLAFLLMDLEDRDLRRFANIVLNTYRERRPEVEGLALLPLYLAMRAAIRSHVAAAAAAHQQDDSRRQAMRAEALRLFARAEDYLAPQPARLVAVGGLSGSGKSRMGRELAPFVGRSPGAVTLRTDVIRKQLAGIDPYAKLPREAYTADMSARTYAALMDQAKRILSTGQSVIADAVFARPEEREAIAAVAREAGVAFTGLWLEAPPEVAAERITSRRRNVSDATPGVLEQQLSWDLGPMTWTRIDSGGPKEDTLAAGRRTCGL
ncbi:AAA family ATPase [Caenispirillum bisanense]|uniref:bifunctional aminoglycoside phosphotransferase/ATP-binding protein n=1 Tax=Caenispirillum bisanense TaxID=414052 RepID=UPI0031E0DF5E